MTAVPFRLGDRSFEATDVAIMGIVNVTPDSFSDGGEFFSADRAVEHALRMVEEGADILDVGGESTRPGAAPVTLAEELRRVIPVIERLSQRCDALISVDTTKAEVARQALDAGAHLVNDVSAGRFEPEILRVTAAAGAGLCLMHMQGEPRTMQRAPTYDDVVQDVTGALRSACQAAIEAGVSADRIIVDPGIGFGKTLAHNLALIRECGAIGRQLGHPVLMGVSRKSFLKALTGRAVQDRLHGTAAAVTASVLAGAQVLRVHDVAAMRDVVVVAQAFRGDAVNG